MRECKGYYRICKGKGKPVLNIRDEEIDFGSLCVDCAEEFCKELTGEDKKRLEVMIGIVKGLSHLKVTELNTQEKK